MNSEKISISHLFSLLIIFWYENYFSNYQIPFLTIPIFIIAPITSLSCQFFDRFNVNMDLVFHENTLVECHQNNGNQFVQQ